LSPTLRLCVFAWYHTGEEELHYKRHINNLAEKALLEPLCFVNSKEVKNLARLTSRAMNEKRRVCWLEAKELNVEFPSNSVYSIVFKPANKGDDLNMELLKTVGII
jgi:hypothetical protein